MHKLLLLPWLTLLLAAADVSGRWSGNITVADTGSGTTIKTPVSAEFQQKADSLSGKIGRRQDAEKVQIRNGKVAGKTIMFEAASVETSGAMRFVLTLQGDHMEGEMKGSVEDAGEITGKVRLTREP